MFGPDDYMGFSFLVFFAIFLFMSRKKDYASNDFKNLEYINIYNALKPVEIVKIYEENQKAPIEEVVEKSLGNFINQIQNLKNTNQKRNWKR